MQIFNPFASGGAGHGPSGSGGIPPKTGFLPVSTGLICSTGGLSGVTGALLVPVTNTKTNKNYLVILDPTDFNCEEDCVYTFPQENVKVGYNVNSYKIIVVYRNIGVVKLTFSITTFRQGLTKYNGNTATIEQGAYYPKSKIMTLGSSVADNKLYTVAFNIQNEGERPQLSLLRKANAGPMAIISVTLIGNADEKDKM